MNMHFLLFRIFEQLALALKFFKIVGMAAPRPPASYVYGHGSKVDLSYCVDGFRADPCHNRAPFVLVVVVALFMVPVFIYFFQTFQNSCGQMCGLGLISVRFRFTKFLPSVVQPTAHLSGLV